MKAKRENIMLRVGKDVVLYAPAKFIPPLLSIAGVYIFTRILSPAEYGEYVLAISLVSLSVIVFFGWISSSVFRFYEEYKAKSKLYIFSSTVSVLYAITAMAAVAGGAIFVYFFINSNELYSYTILLLILLISLHSIFLNYLNACRNILQYNLVTSFESIGKIAFAVILVLFLNRKVTGILFGFCTTYLIILSFLFFLHRKSIPVSIKNFSGSLGRSFFKYGYPLVGVAVLSWVLSLADRYIIQLLKGPTLVGVYSAGYQVASNIIQIPYSLLMLAAFPIVIQTYENKNPGETERLLTGLVSIYIILSTPILLIVTLFPEFIIRIFLGKEFSEISSSLSLISIGQFFLGLSTFMHKSIELNKKTSKILLLLFISSLVNIGFNFLLIPWMNEIGAAVATLVSYFVYLLLAWKYGKKLMAWKFPNSTLFKCLLSAAICFAIYYVFFKFVVAEFTNMLSIIGILLCILIFFGILIIIKEKSLINLIQEFKYLKSN